MAKIIWSEYDFGYNETGAYGFHEVLRKEYNANIADVIKELDNIAKNSAYKETDYYNNTYEYSIYSVNNTKKEIHVAMKEGDN